MEEERDFQAWVMDALKRFGWLAFHGRTVQLAKSDRFVTAYTGDKGFPDIAAIRRGDIILAELKTMKGRADRDQQKWIENGAYLWRPCDRTEILERIK